MKKIFRLLSYSVSLFLALLSFKSQSQNINSVREMAILNIQLREADSTTSFQYSAEYIAQCAGIPYIITTDPSEAVKYKIILSTTDFLSSTLTTDEKQMLTDYVAQGGIWIVPRMDATALYSLFGIQEYTKTFSNKSVHWDVSQHDPLMRWINDDYEETISLGSQSPEVDSVIKTQSYTPTTAHSLAEFPDGGSAVLRNSYGLGYTFTLGFSVKDLILTNQLEEDFDAYRMTANGFEPTSDVIVLFFRAIYQTYIQAAVWKHTAPYHAKSVLMITHDVDSQTGMDTMNYFAEWEQPNAIKAMYTINTKNFHDCREKSFYNDTTIPLIKLVMQKNQSIGNHSYGHFPDYFKTSRFPFGAPGDTLGAYNPRYTHGDSTINGTAYGEIEMSDFLLKRDLKIVPRVWRSGSLANHPHEAEILDTIGYSYTTTYSANDVLTNFPFHLKARKSFTGATLPIIEIPMTISDVFKPISIDNIFTIADLWLTVISKNRDNYTPVVLLIHPNRRFKLLGEQYLVSHLPKDVLIMDIADFGDYWRDRENLKYHTQITNDTLSITVENNQPFDPALSLMIENSETVNHYIVKTTDGEPINFKTSAWNDSETLLTFDTVSAPQISVQTHNIYCNDQNIPIQLQLSGRPPYYITYSINNTRYSVRTSDNILNFTTQNPDSFQINSFSDQSGRFADVLPKIIYTHELTPIPEFTYQDTVRTISFTNTSQNSDNYVWDFGDGNTSTEFEPVHQYEEDGTYLVTLTGENQSCDNQTYSTDIIINTISVLNIGSDNFVKISPNPFFNQLNAQFISPRNQTAEIEIFNQTGIRIYRSTVSLTCGENNFTIKFPEKPNQGIYFAKISSGTDVQIIKLINMNR